MLYLCYSKIDDQEIDIGIWEQLANGRNEHELCGEAANQRKH